MGLWAWPGSQRGMGATPRTGSPSQLLSSLPAAGVKFRVLERESDGPLRLLMQVRPSHTPHHHTGGSTGGSPKTSGDRDPHLPSSRVVGGVPALGLTPRHPSQQTRRAVKACGCLSPLCTVLGEVCCPERPGAGPHEATARKLGQGLADHHCVLADKPTVLQPCGPQLPPAQLWLPPPAVLEFLVPQALLRGAHLPLEAEGGQAGLRDPGHQHSHRQGDRQPHVWTSLGSACLHLPAPGRWRGQGPSLLLLSVASELCRASSGRQPLQAEHSYAGPRELLEGHRPTCGYPAHPACSAPEHLGICVACRHAGRI